MITEFNPNKCYLFGSTKDNPLVREVLAFGTSETEQVSRNGSSRLVFVERYLGDRIEAWVSVVMFDGEKEYEAARHNAKMLHWIEFDCDLPECRL